MNITPEAFGELFETFSGEAFRLETLDDYSQSGGVDAYRAFLAGEQQPESYKSAGWVTTVRNATRAGKRIYRVHILSRPLTDYLRFELGWGYIRNQEAGEEFYILDTTDQPNPLDGVPDYWLFSDQLAVTMEYDENLKFLGADSTSDVSAWITHRDTAMAHAVPFREWWEQHGSE